MLRGNLRYVAERYVSSLKVTSPTVLQDCSGAIVISFIDVIPIRVYVSLIRPSKEYISVIGDKDKNNNPNSKAFRQKRLVDTMKEYKDKYILD